MISIDVEVQKKRLSKYECRYRRKSIMASSKSARPNFVDRRISCGDC